MGRETTASSPPKGTLCRFLCCSKLAQPRPLHPQLRGIKSSVDNKPPHDFVHIRQNVRRAQVSATQHFQAKPVLMECFLPRFCATDRLPLISTIASY